MCISGGSKSASSQPVPKKKKTLMKSDNDRPNRFEDDDKKSLSPRSSVAGRSGFDSFGNTPSKGYDPRGRM